MWGIKIDTLKRLDAEEKKINDELWKSLEGTDQIEDLAVKDVVGHDLEKPLAAVPRSPCGVPAGSVWSLLPLYQTVLLPVSNSVSFDGEKVYPLNKIKTFEKYYDMSPNDFIMLAEKGRVIPYFPYSYQRYDKEFIKPFLEPGIPRITHDRLILLNRLNYCKSYKSNCEQCSSFLEMARKDLEKIAPTTNLNKSSCASCLAGVYMQGHREKILKVIKSKKKKGHIVNTICSAEWLITSRNMDSILYTNCQSMLKTITTLSPLPEPATLEYIMKGLKVLYNPKIPLETYLDIIDGKTSRALRSIVKKIMKDPLATKYLDRTNAKIFEINREVENLSKNKISKVFSATTDVVIYGGSKFIEHQSNKYINLPEKELKKVGEWLSEKGMDIEGKIKGRDWEIAQLYRTRCKLEKC